VRALVLVVATGSVAHAETWYTYAAFRNDVFSEAIPPMDDVGFTHDNVFSLRRANDRDAFGGAFQHRFITSRDDRRRWDQVDLVALGERTLPYGLLAGVRLGPTLGGNFGGRWMQNGWHSISGTGPTVDEGLANDYPGGRRIGALAGAHVRWQVERDYLQGYAILDSQVAVGQTGVTSVESVAGGHARWWHLGASAELAVARYHVSDDNLALPGGYRTGWQLEWRVGVDVAWSRFRVSYQYRANESGSGEPVGVIAFQSRR
jgi:hypothetical protein